MKAWIGAFSRIAVIAAMALSAVVVLAACSDDPPSPVPQRDDALVTQPSGISAASVRMREHVHSRNRFDWVGTAHNKMISDFRKELRKPGILTRNICDYMLEFSSDDARVPAGFDVQKTRRRSIAASGARQGTLCAKAVAVAAPTSYRRRSLNQEVSPEAVSLSAQVDAALDLAGDSYDLAARLVPVLDAASSLSEVDHAIVAATVAVAQSSFEYWEVEYTGFEQEVASDYGPCASDRRDSGYTMDDARASCLGGRESFQTFWDWPTAPGPSKVLTHSGKRACGPGLRAGFKHIAKNDARGAFSGAIAGAVAGGPGGAVGGAIVAGGTASTWAAIENAWSTFWCMM